MPARQAAPCLKCNQIVEPNNVAFVADFRLRAVGMEENVRSPQASVSICVPCADLMANGDEPSERTRPLDHLVYELLREMIANDLTFQLHKWAALRKEMGMAVPALADPKVLRAFNEFQRTLKLPALQTINAGDEHGEGKNALVKAS
jgi:hypothetical protein